MKAKTKELMSDTWWIDYMEDDTDHSDRTTMELMLEHSVTDQLILENYKAARRQIKSSDPAQEYEKLLNDPTYLKKHHDQIMQAISRTKPEPKPMWMRFLQKSLPAWVYAAAHARGLRI